MESTVGNPERNEQEVEQEDDYVQEVLVSPSSNKGKAKRKRMKDRSEVWDHFLKKETPLGLRAVCKYCSIEYKCNPKKNGTSVLWGHLNRCRKYPYNTPKDSKQSLLSFKDVKVAGSASGRSGLTYQKYDPATVRKALSFMVIVDELPFKFVEGVGFRQFCNAMEPRFHVPSRITVAKDCFQTYLTEKRKLKSVLKNCNSRVSLTTDSWTSIQQINYMCLTVHFIDNNWKLQKRILNFCPITSHKGEEVGKEVEKCLLDWELEKIFCITVDNATSNDTAIGYLRKKINHWKSGVLKGRFLHMRCVAHIINLVVSDGLKTVNESITRVRHAVRFMKQSPARLLRFKKCVSEEKINTITEIYVSKVAKTLINNLREALNAMYEEYRAFSSSDVLKEEVSSSKDQTQFSPKQKKIEVLKSKYKKHKFEKEGGAKIELDKYLEEETEDDNEEFDILGWWKFNSARFPTMGSMARDVLAVPILTVASESAFSTGGRFLDVFRSSLTPRVVEGLVCAQNWLRASPIPNIEECLEEVEQLEEDLGNMTLADDIDQVLVD